MPNNLFRDNILNIDIKDINLADERYKVSLSKTDITTLANSINHTGLLYPSILRPADNNTYIIVSGFNRVSALIKNDIPNTLAITLSPNTSELDCYKKAIAAYASKHALTHAELIVCLKHLKSFCDEQTISDMSLAIFNTQLNIRFIKDLLCIADMPEPALDLIHNANMSIKSAKRITGFSIQASAMFLNVFSKIKASSSKQLEIITYVFEISARDGIKPETVLNDQNIQSILSNTDTPAGVKANEIRTFLYEKRFPSLFSTRQKVKEQIKALKLGNTIKLTPPENFEGPNYTLSFTAKNHKEFQSNIQKLNSISQNDRLKQIFTP